MRILEILLESLLKEQMKKEAIPKKRGSRVDELDIGSFITKYQEKTDINVITSAFQVLLLIRKVERDRYRDVGSD